MVMIDKMVTAFDNDDSNDGDIFFFIIFFTDFFTILYTYYKSHITSCKFYMLLIENHLHNNGM